MEQLSSLIKNSNNPDNNWFNYFFTLLGESLKQLNNAEAGSSGFVAKKALNYIDNKQNEIQKKMDENTDQFKNLDYRPGNSYMRGDVCKYSIEECKFNGSRLECEKKKPQAYTRYTPVLGFKCGTQNKKQSICACLDVKQEDKVKKMNLIKEGEQLQKKYEIVNNVFIHGNQILKCGFALYGLFKGHKDYMKNIESTPINSKMDNYQDFFVVALDNKPLPLTGAGNNVYADFDVINDTLKPCLFFGTDRNSIIIRGINDNASQLKKMLKLDPSTDPVYVNDNNLKLLIYTSILPTISQEESPDFYNLISNRIEETRRVSENRIVKYTPNLQLQVLNDLNNGNNCNLC